MRCGFPNSFIKMDPVPRRYWLFRKTEMRRGFDSVTSGKASSISRVEISEILFGLPMVGSKINLFLFTLKAL